MTCVFESLYWKFCFNYIKHKQFLKKYIKNKDRFVLHEFDSTQYWKEWAFKLGD